MCLLFQTPNLWVKQTFLYSVRRPYKNFSISFKSPCLVKMVKRIFLLIWEISSTRRYCHFGLGSRRPMDLEPVSWSRANFVRRAQPLDAVVVDAKVLHLANEEVAAAANEGWQDAWRVARNEQIATDRVSQAAAVVLGDVLVSDGHRKPVAANADVHVHPAVVAEHWRVELRPAAVGLSIDEERCLKLAEADKRDEGEFWWKKSGELLRLPENRLVQQRRSHWFGSRPPWARCRFSALFWTWNCSQKSLWS